MAHPLIISADAGALARDAAALIAHSSRDAIAARGAFHFALSGGGTPRLAYQALATRTDIDWPRVHLWWSDERDVPSNSPASNYHTAFDALIACVPIPASNVHRVRTELGAEAAASQYETEILERMKDEGGRMKENGLHPSSFILHPSFDLILLGLGDDGHTASLFPGTLAALSPERLVAAHYVPQAAMWRITFTPRLINAARRVAFLVSGLSKAGMLARVRNGPFDPDALPAQAIAPASGELVWLADAEAAHNIAADDNELDTENTDEHG